MKNNFSKLLFWIVIGCSMIMTLLIICGSVNFLYRFQVTKNISDVFMSVGLGCTGISFLSLEIYFILDEI